MALDADRAKAQVQGAMNVHEPQGTEERILSSRTAFRGELLRVQVDEVEVRAGRHATREMVVHRGAVVVVAIHERKVVMERQYRHAAKKALWELPAGTLEEGEAPEECAKRELLEETGFKASAVEELSHFYVAPGYSTEMIHLFYTEDVSPSIQSQEHDEDIEVHLVPIESAIGMVHANEIEDAKTIIGILLLKARLERKDPGKNNTAGAKDGR
uniref:NUDIX hydrolase n=1 Tax=Candidatus Methanomethylicus mesodigestus TaxID=1867258 RepID=A0A7C3F0D3_9CREN